MTTNETTPRPNFDPDDFTALTGGHGATKLAESAVAPLTAAARGYESVHTGKDNIRDTLTRYRIGAANTVHGRQFTTAVGDSDAMVMPWFSMDQVSADRINGKDSAHTTLQMRPETPVLNKDGKPAKYINLAGKATVLDIHPATPLTWWRDAPRVMFIEGIIKGDSALSALLRANDISDDDLRDDHSGDPRQRLHDLMERVPEAERVLVINFIGVHNWRRNPEWSSFSAEGRTALVAYDADAAANFQVWSAMDSLTTYLAENRKAKEVEIINTAKVVPDAAERKLGLDDFFSGHGRWEDVINMYDALPDRPVNDITHGAVVGAFRVNQAGNAVEKAVRSDEGDGESIRWRPAVPIGGRLINFEVTRQPTKDEVNTGRLQPNVDTDYDANVEIEVTWRPDGADNDISRIVRGPATILVYPPREWERRGARMPNDLLQHPSWPPADTDGYGWLHAMKANRSDETEHRVRWRTMGWAPTTEPLPVYLVGDIAVGREGMVDPRDLVGVNESVLAGSSAFGVIATDKPGDDDTEWMAQARDDLRDVIDVYINSGAWQDENIAATVLALALRPALPVPSRTTAYFVGPPRRGKSFTAAQIMSFWQPVPDSWSGSRLPGSATDTIASMEHAVAHANIWVSDDLAPSPDRNRASQEEASLGNVIRAIHNGSGKRRMGPDMKAREVLHPRAELIVTAENEPSVRSVIDRSVMVHIGDGALHPDTSVTQQLEEMRSRGGQASRLTYAFLRWHLWRASQLDGGWEEMVERLENMRASTQKWVTEHISTGGDATRHATMAADLMIALQHLFVMAEDIDADIDIRKLLHIRELPTRVAQQLARGHDEQRRTTPGQSVVQAVSLLLSSGKAHIALLEDPSATPGSVSYAGGSDGGLVDRLLGWVTQPGQEARAQGPQLGWLTTAKDRKTPVVLLRPVVAFNEGQRAYPELLPYGSKQGTTWSSLWGEGLTVPEDIGWTRAHNGRSTRTIVRVQVDGQSVSGVPVLLSTLLSGGNTNDDELDDGDDEDDEDDDMDDAA